MKSVILKKIESKKIFFRILFLIAFALSLFVSIQIIRAEPPLPTEFYGTIYSFNVPASSGTVKAYAGNVTCGQFSLVNGGYYGVLSCLSDDPKTTQVEGAVDGQNVTFYYDNNPATAFGEYYFSSGNYSFVNITFPELVCGDGFCDRLENCYSCEIDCFKCNATSNQTGNNTGNYTGNETGDTGDGGTSSGGGGSGGGSSAGSGGAGSYTPPDDGLQDTPCAENWQCANWSECSVIGVQNRSCYDANGCGTYNSKPLEVQECIYEGSCFDNLINCHNSLCEEGVDCGGPCEKKCSAFEQPFQNMTISVPKFEMPKTFCEKKFDFTNFGFWIFIIILLLSVIIRYYIERYLIEKAKKNENLNSLSRSRKIIAEQRITKLFIISVIFLAIGFLTYSYFFLLCPNIFFEYGWLLLLFILIAPLAVYAISRDLAYNERIHFDKEKRLDDLHYQSLVKMIDLENTILSDEETVLANKIYELSKNDEIKDIMFKYPEIKKIYKLMMELYDKYSEKKNPFDLEKDLCDTVYQLKQDVEFNKRITPYPELKEIFERLQSLYQQYEEKQKLYDQIDKIESVDKNAKKKREEIKEETTPTDEKEHVESKAHNDEEHIGGENNVGEHTVDEHAHTNEIKK
jgi:uncharacterized membrane protein YgcG